MTGEKKNEHNRFFNEAQQNFPIFYTSIHIYTVLLHAAYLDRRFPASSYLGGSKNGSKKVRKNGEWKGGTRGKIYEHTKCAIKSEYRDAALKSETLQRAPSDAALICGWIAYFPALHRGEIDIAR